jgi:hypothetical protein
MTIEDGVATIEDIDKGAATVTVAPAQPPVGEAPASNPADSAPAIQAETPAVPSDEGPADAPAQEPKKFHANVQTQKDAPCAPRQSWKP